MPSFAVLSSVLVFMNKMVLFQKDSNDSSSCLLLQLPANPT